MQHSILNSSIHLRLHTGSELRIDCPCIPCTRRIRIRIDLECYLVCYVRVYFDAMMLYDAI